MLEILISQQVPQILFLSKTKYDGKRDDYIQRRLHFSHCFSVPSNGRSSGLALFWSNNVQLSVTSSSAHHIDADIGSLGISPPWRLTGFYGYATLLRGQNLGISCANSVPPALSHS